MQVYQTYELNTALCPVINFNADPALLFAQPLKDHQVTLEACEQSLLRAAQAYIQMEDIELRLRKYGVADIHIKGYCDSGHESFLGLSSFKRMVYDIRMVDEWRMLMHAWLQRFKRKSGILSYIHTHFDNNSNHIFPRSLHEFEYPKLKDQNAITTLGAYLRLCMVHEGLMSSHQQPDVYAELVDFSLADMAING
ncbi:MAG: hypothetical protein PUF37_10075 [Prevotellaceae bacterium]|nr:hypothetical protein [Prevotellaceae bacterium]